MPYDCSIKTKDESPSRSEILVDVRLAENLLEDKLAANQDAILRGTGTPLSFQGAGHPGGDCVRKRDISQGAKVCLGA